MLQNPLKPISYTNKDFNSIFVELLDIVKELSSKWDPSISNESDPGVILLKADAIIADKNNYNIDKNILEAFPETATQELNVRNLYSQLAYKMPWYRSASTEIYFKYLISEDLTESNQILIPKYTMITNEDTDVIYTILEDVIFTQNQDNTTVPALQGILNIHQVHGDSNIQLGDIDSNNRLYFSDYNIAQNGIFIENTENGNQWTQVDNLQVEPNGNYYYEFGIDSRNSVCYIEFPEDVSKLIKSGITIRYIVSEGENGNIAGKVLDRFYNDTTGKIINGQQETTLALNNDNVQLYNIDGTHDGYDPESIEQAFKSYKRTAGTFNTLITLRDYIDAIYNSGYASNVVVSDRLHDIQSSYNVITEDTVNKEYTYMKKDTTKEVIFNKIHVPYETEINDNDNYYYPPVKDSNGFYFYKVNESISVTNTEGSDFYKGPLSDTYDMDAFDLRLYVLHNPGIIKTINDYDSSFNIEEDKEVIEQIKLYIKDQQSILHDYKNILEDIPFMFFNTFPLKIKIIPQQKLSNLEITQVKENILTSLMSSCNAHSIDFGAEPDYNLIYDTILNSDERIKLIVLDDFDYTTFATYYDVDTHELKQIPISKSNSSFILHIGSQQDVDKLYNKNVYDIMKLENCYIICDNNFIYNEEQTGEYEFKQDYIYIYNTSTSKLEEYSNKLKDFRLQIICKSILDGRTPLFNTYKDFIYTILQDNKANEKKKYITSGIGIYPFSTTSDSGSLIDTDITLPDSNDISVIIPNNTTLSGTTKGTYTLLENEMIRVYSPSFKSTTTYSNYIKYEFYSGGNIKSLEANTTYPLLENEYITFYWRDIDEKDAPWNYRIYKGGTSNNPFDIQNRIKPSFRLDSVTEPIINANSEITSGKKYIGDVEYESITNLTTDLGATNTVDIIEPIQVRLNKDKNYIYIVTNNILDNQYKMKFNKINLGGNNGYIYRYTLQQDEYFIHTNLNKTELEILGSGTMIGIYSTIELSLDPEISNNIVSFNDIINNGISAINDWQTIDFDNMFIREQSITTISQGDTITLVTPDISGPIDVNYADDNIYSFTSWQDTELDGSKYSMSYTDNQNNSSDISLTTNDVYFKSYARAYFNVNSSDEISQEISKSILFNENYKSFQFIAYKDNEESNEYYWKRYPELSTEQDYDKCYINLNYPVQALGGFNIDISYIDLYSNSLANKLYIYTINELTGFNLIENNIINISGTDPTIENINIPQGNYILKIVNKEDEEFTIIRSGESLIPINSNSATNKKGTYYYRISAQDSLQFTLTSGYSIEAYPLDLYTEEEKFATYHISLDDIINNIKILDYENKFKYDYIIPESDYIEDPLQSVSLFNSKHILNNYTIAQAQLNQSTDFTDSYISIINNKG